MTEQAPELSRRRRPRVAPRPLALYGADSGEVSAPLAANRPQAWRQRLKW